ncbi:nicotinate (nicotinamide) nucleotide adenylyltransferase [Candidatus Mycoplasma haematominutum]|uniref:Probable nicotinate-nucleotide adenylyltransferase n=1 Tax=Candidatus Mycoplasma haematominutum 'Birmingham 1' TaxID=1116213 RepID=G8C2X1_9MOLU|nr:nicotinate (nicotinamide) nucleotide adenylyltransferase [Candidatus Mycoplasma haematominutum]CCE66669.1 nicotinate-nucleotide adenylyltransferase [Candidatus Mycoplasma haematominutum 'Birmingham 1']
MYPYKKIRIGLFGGSFNPPHEAHMKLSNFAIKKLKLDFLIFIPTFQSVDKHKCSYLNGQERKYMLEISRNKKKTIISTFELSLQQPVQSIVTIRHFRNFFKDAELFFLLGDDHLSTLHTWENIDELVNLITVVILRRSTAVQLIKLHPELTSKLLFLDNPIYIHSSSSVRENVDFTLLNKKVAQYLKDTKLFA